MLWELSAGLKKEFKEGVKKMRRKGETAVHVRLYKEGVASGPEALFVYYSLRALVPMERGFYGCGQDERGDKKIDIWGEGV